MPQAPRRQLPDFASILTGLKTALTELAEDAVTEGVKRGTDGLLGVLEDNAHGVVQRIAQARGKVRTKSVAAAAPLERRVGDTVTVEGEPRKRKTKARSARRR